jgi:hypothetical protein
MPTAAWVTITRTEMAKKQWQDYDRVGGFDGIGG